MTLPQVENIWSTLRIVEQLTLLLFLFAGRRLMSGSCIMIRVFTTIWGCMCLACATIFFSTLSTGWTLQLGGMAVHYSWYSFILIILYLFGIYFINFRLKNAR